MSTPNPQGPPDEDVDHDDVDVDELATEQEPSLDPAGPTELGDAVDG